jgi:dolichol-phosphate mannosyltransferase
MKSMYKDLDIVIPCFNEAKNLIPLIEEVENKLKGQFERVNLIMVDDGSKDETMEIISRVMETSTFVTIDYLRFTRNFGKEIAVKCGLDHSHASFCVIMDADL